MKKKEIKKTKLKPRSRVEVIKNQNGVILERMEHKFDLLSEGFSVLDKRFDRLEKKVDDNHRETNNNFKTLFEFRNEMKSFKNETNSNFKVSFEYLSKIDDEIQSIKEEMAEMKINMDEGIDPVKFSKLERKVGMIEKKLLIVMGNN